MYHQFKELFQTNPTQNTTVPEIQREVDKGVTLQQHQIQNEGLEVVIAQERAEAIKALLQESREINQLVKTTATLVDEQGEEIDSIRNNIANAKENIVDGSLNVRVAEASKSSCSLF